MTPDFGSTRRHRADDREIEPAGVSRAGRVPTDPAAWNPDDLSMGPGVGIIGRGHGEITLLFNGAESVADPTAETDRDGTAGLERPVGPRVHPHPPFVVLAGPTRGDELVRIAAGDVRPHPLRRH